MSILTNILLFQYYLGSLLRDSNKEPIGIMSDCQIGLIVRLQVYKAYIDEIIASTLDAYKKKCSSSSIKNTVQKLYIS